MTAIAWLLCAASVWVTLAATFERGLCAGVRNIITAALVAAAMIAVVLVVSVLCAVSFWVWVAFSVVMLCVMIRTFPAPRRVYD